MPDKATFNERVAALRLNPDAIERIEVVCSNARHHIRNVEGQRGSIQVYAAITSADSRITPEAARKGLEIFGDELRQETDDNPEKHPHISLLEGIARRNKSAESYVVRRDSAKPMPFTRDKLEEIADRFGTPFIIYDEQGIRQTLRNLYSAFSWNSGFKEFFAVKACPTPDILEICRQEGAGADCSSAPELDLSWRVGIRDEDIMFTSNNTPALEFARARNLGAIINFDDITHIPFFIDNVGKLPETACVRYNPGAERVGNSIIGNPVEAKYGMTREQVFKAFEMMKAGRVKRFGLHTMVASNELNPQYHIDTAVMLFDLVRQVKERTGIDVEFVNTGGGWGVNYKPEQLAINPEEIGQGVREAYERMITEKGLAPLSIFMENGRFVTGPHGWLVTRARHEKHIYRDYIGVDACMSDFMRPGMYGIYQHISVPGKEEMPHDRVYDVTGALCENNDKFAVQRPLPEIKAGDLVVLDDAGAHGRAMGFRYNGRLGCQQLLSRVNGKVETISRAETEKDYFATFDFPGSKYADLAH